MKEEKKSVIILVYIYIYVNKNTDPTCVVLSIYIAVVLLSYV